MRSCRRKVAYREAWMAARALNRYPRELAAMMKTYRCPCGAWHVGHPKITAGHKVEALLARA